MILIYGFEEYTLEALCQQRAPSPEDFLADLEQQFEDGDITEEEVVQLMKDFTGRSK